MKKLLVILGSTATGKTDLALTLAKKFNGEIVSCDSRQIYIGMDVGTGKMPGRELSNKNEELSLKKQKNYWEIDRIRVWMYDVVDPKVQYTVADYVKDANRVIGEIYKRGKLPIIVGGTGLYLKVLLEGLDSLAIPPDKTLRKKLQKLSLNQLQKKLQKVNPQKWQQMNNSDRQNPRRLVRAIELALKMPEVPSTKFQVPNRNILKIGLISHREVLYQKVDERVIKRIKQGMIEESKRLNKNGLTLKRMRQLGLEYHSLADYLDKKIQSRDDLVKIMQHKIHGYVRRQLTWFKKEKGIFWFDITDKNFSKNVEKIITKWYYQA